MAVGSDSQIFSKDWTKALVGTRLQRQRFMKSSSFALSSRNKPEQQKHMNLCCICFAFRVALSHIQLHYLALHCPTLPYTTLHYTHSLHSLTTPTKLHYTSLHYITSHCTTPHYIALHCNMCNYVRIYIY